MSTPITLLRSQSSDDSSAMSIVNNKNAKVIEDALNKLRYDLEHINVDASITQDQFNTMLANSKNSVLIRADMTDGAFVDFNGYRITRIGVPAGSTAPIVEFRVTDTNITRNTNFRTSLISFRDFAGYFVYPTILADSTFISIIFYDVADMSPTTINPLSDPNNKRLTIL